MPVHVPIKAEDIFKAAASKGPGEWLIGYRSAREIKKMVDCPDFPWPCDTLLGHPVTFTLGYGVAFLPTAA